MKTDKITISLFRVSTDSKYLDMIFDCPMEYYFNSLILEVRYVENNTFKSKQFDLSNALFKDPETGEVITTQKHWIVRLPLEKLDIMVPAIYIGHLKADLVDSEEPINTLSDTMICSDVNKAYRCMLDELLVAEGSCEDAVSDEVIRKYLLLYGHQAALSVEDLEYAQIYFKLIGKCFNSCGASNRPGCGCGCGAGGNSPESFRPSKPSNCGCK